MARTVAIGEQDPRRFGKTLAMNMLDCFFSLSYAGRSDLSESGGKRWYDGLAFHDLDFKNRLSGGYCWPAGI